jgi:predicted nucleotide-binding protein
VEVGERSYHLAPKDGSSSEFFLLYESMAQSASGRWTFLSENKLELGKFSFRYARYSDRSSATVVEVELVDRALMDRTLDSLLRSKDHSIDTTISDEPAKEVDEGERKPMIFIGHGRSAKWLSLKSHLTDQHGYQVVAYETGARAGHHIRDILDDMATMSSIAFMVMTGEDELTSGSYQARPNVIHETGLFQGRLGFSRAIVLLEDGCAEFSNLAGIQQLRFKDIRETFGDVLATIKREFGK